MDIFAESRVVNGLSVSIVNFQEFLNMGFLFSQGKVKDSEIILFGLSSANEYQSVDDFAAFNHPGLLSSPESGVDNCCRVSSCGCS